MPPWNRMDRKKQSFYCLDFGLLSLVIRRQVNPMCEHYNERSADAKVRAKLCGRWYEMFVSEAPPRLEGNRAKAKCQSLKREYISNNVCTIFDVAKNWNLNSKCALCTKISISNCRQLYENTNGRHLASCQGTHISTPRRVYLSTNLCRTILIPHLFHCHYFHPQDSISATRLSE